MANVWDQAGYYRWFSRVVLGAEKIDRRNRYDDKQQRKSNEYGEQADVHANSQTPLQKEISKLWYGLVCLLLQFTMFENNRERLYASTI